MHASGSVVAHHAGRTLVELPPIDPLQPVMPCRAALRSANHARRALYQLCTDASSSASAQLYHYLMMCVILVSTIGCVRGQACVRQCAWPLTLSTWAKPQPCQALGGASWEQCACAWRRCFVVERARPHTNEQWMAYSVCLLNSVRHSTLLFSVAPLSHFPMHCAPAASHALHASHALCGHTRAL